MRQKKEPLHEAAALFASGERYWISVKVVVWELSNELWKLFA